MRKNQKLDAIRHVLSTIFNSQETFETLTPEFKMTVMAKRLSRWIQRK